MPSDANGPEFTEFQLEEIAMGRAHEARRRLAARDAGDDDPVRTRLAEVRKEIEGIQDALSATGDDPDVSIPDNQTLARYLDDSLTDESRLNVERALAGSAEARRRLIDMYRDVHACAHGESLPQSAPPEETIIPYNEAQPIESVESTPPRLGLVLGVTAAVLFWAAAALSPVAWQTPLAFAAVAAIAMVVMHRSCASTLEAMSLTQRRLMQSCLIIMAGTGLCLAFLNAQYVPIACSMIVTALVGLVAAFTANPTRKETANPAVEHPQAPDSDDADPRRHGTGGG